jgi:hypothetical protein
MMTALNNAQERRDVFPPHPAVDVSQVCQLWQRICEDTCNSFSNASSMKRVPRTCLERHGEDISPGNEEA